MNVRFAAATDVGRRRSHNEDAYRADAPLGLFLVADGMGGHAAGEVASATIAEAVHQFVTEAQEDRDKTWPVPLDPALSDTGNRLRAAILVANRVLARRTEEDAALRGMASTLAAVLYGAGRVVVANVGDCRAYLRRADALQQLTRDHSWVAEQVEAGLLTVEAARNHPWRRLVTRALSGGDLSVDVQELDVHPGDQLLLCSDGLHSVVQDAQILTTLLGARGDLQVACQALVDLANSQGGPDNITVLVVELPPAAPGDAPTTA